MVEYLQVIKLLLTLVCDEYEIEASHVIKMQPPIIIQIISRLILFMN